MSLFLTCRLRWLDHQLDILFDSWLSKRECALIRDASVTNLHHVCRNFAYPCDLPTPKCTMLVSQMMQTDMLTLISKSEVRKTFRPCFIFNLKHESVPGYKAFRAIFFCFIERGLTLSCFINLNWTVISNKDTCRCVSWMKRCHKPQFDQLMRYYPHQATIGSVLIQYGRSYPLKWIERKFGVVVSSVPNMFPWDPAMQSAYCHHAIIHAQEVATQYGRSRVLRWIRNPVSVRARDREKIHLAISRNSRRGMESPVSNTDRLVQPEIELEKEPTMA